jgi:hypothetical protein
VTYGGGVEGGREAEGRARAGIKARCLLASIFIACVDGMYGCGKRRPNRYWWVLYTITYVVQPRLVGVV